MAGLAIVIPRSGPGTGPVLPDPLYSLSTADPLYRWEASRLSGANDTPITSFADALTSKALVATTGAPRLMDAGPSAYLSFPLGLSTIFEVAGTALPKDFSYAMLVRSGNASRFGNNIINFNSWLSGIAGSGSWQTSASNGGSGFVASGAVAVDTWYCIQGSISGTNPTATRHKVNAGSLVGPGTIATAPSDNTLGLIRLLGQSAATGRLELASLVFWSRLRTDVEMANDYQAIQAGSPLI